MSRPFVSYVRTSNNDSEIKEMRQCILDQDKELDRLRDEYDRILDGIFEHCNMDTAEKIMNYQRRSKR